MRALIVKVLKPTSTKGTRLQATSLDHKTVTAYDYQLSSNENYAMAAADHLAKNPFYQESNSFKWFVLSGGIHPNGRDMVYIIEGRFC